jgi:hypothetical protein
MTAHQYSRLIEDSRQPYPVIVWLRNELVSLLRDRRCDLSETAQLLAAMYGWWPGLSPLRSGKYRRGTAVGSIARLILEQPGISTSEIIHCLPDAPATAQSIRQMVHRMIRKKDVLRDGKSLYLTMIGEHRSRIRNDG